jgi:hypothetical protein
LFFLPQNSSGAITRIELLERLWVYYKDRACGTALGLLKGYGLWNGSVSQLFMSRSSVFICEENHNTIIVVPQAISF